MSHSNLTNNKALRNANYFLTALVGSAIVMLAAALIISVQGWLPDLTGTEWFIGAVLRSVFFYSGLCSTLFIYAYIYCWYLEHSWNYLIGGVLLAILLIIAEILHLVALPSLANSVALVIWSCCIIGLIRQISIEPDKRALNFNLLLTMILPLLFIILANFFLSLTIVLHPKTQDELLLAIDGTLGFYPSFLAGQLFALLPDVIFLLIKFIYMILPCALAVIYVGRYYQDKQPPFAFIIEFFLIGIGGMLLYHINTGCGPINAFKGIWPQHLPEMPFYPVERLCTGSFLPRNCLPSLHTAWAVCVWRHSLRCDRKIRQLITVWVLCTLASTLGLGEHYLVDLMVGFAFATLVGGICAIDLSLQQPARKNAILYGGLVCLGWYLIINFGLTLLRLSPMIAWSCFIGSIALCGKLEFDLSRAQKLLTTERTALWNRANNLYRN